MPHFIVAKLHDAYVRYETLVEADSADHAREIASYRSYEGEWIATGQVDEFDHFDMSENDIEQVEADFVLEETNRYELTAPQRDIIIAALRLWQRLDTFSIPPSVQELARNGRETHLTVEEIDSLVESINHD